MTIKSALSVAALTVALTGAAFAQGMTINGAAVSEGDMPAVQERCDELANAERHACFTARRARLTPLISDWRSSNRSVARGFAER